MANRLHHAVLGDRPDNERRRRFESGKVVIAQVAKSQTVPRVWLYDFDELRRTVAAIEDLRKAVGTVNPRPPGWHNNLIQLIKKLLARLLAWYMRPVQEFNAAVSRSLEEIFYAVDHLSTNIYALEGRLARAEKRSATLSESMQEQFEFIQEQAKALAGLQKTASLEGPAGRMKPESNNRARENPQFCIDTDLGNDRTAYVIGLFGSGRTYINELMLHNIGERARYLRDFIRLHPGPTRMIYSGHATMKHFSRGQHSPAVMGGVLEAIRSGFADLIFVYRHPLDSLLTNWIWWPPQYASPTKRIALKMRSGKSP
jgi:hypothetical protein